MIHFRLLNIPVRVHWMFLLLTLFLGGGLRAESTSDWHRVFIFMLAAFISILIHELGHALTGLKMGAPKTMIELHGFGGAAMFPNSSFTRKQNILVSFAGPGASILTGILFYFVMSFLVPQLEEGPYVNEVILNFLATMVFVNFFWSAINLCPIMPMDGGQILKNILGPGRIRITCIIGFVTIGILGLALWVLTQSIYNMIIILLLASYTWNMWEEASKK